MQKNFPRGFEPPTLNFNQQKKIKRQKGEGSVMWLYQSFRFATVCFYPFLSSFFQHSVWNDVEGVEKGGGVSGGPRPEKKWVKLVRFRAKVEESPFLRKKIKPRSTNYAFYFILKKWRKSTVLRIPCTCIRTLTAALKLKCTEIHVYVDGFRCSAQM